MAEVSTKHNPAADDHSPRPARAGQRERRTAPSVPVKRTPNRQGRRAAGRKATKEVAKAHRAPARASKPNAPAPDAPVVIPGDGTQLLQDIEAILRRYVILPPEAYDAVVLWTVATHAQEAWEHASRLIVASPQRRCGKTRLLELLGGLVHAPLQTVNISVAALVRCIDERDPPTIILDEADAIFATRRGGDRSELAEALRDILCAGHNRGWPYRRWDARARRVEECPTYAMAALGGIDGHWPDTILDRAVRITMQRRAPSERLEHYRARKVRPELHKLRECIRAWAIAHMRELRAAVPAMPVEDRAADTWEPLIAVADLAGGEWPARARRACVVLTRPEEPEDATRGERLLRDLALVWRGEEETVSTAELLPRLHALEDAPWADLADGWPPLDARRMAGLLRPYEVRPVNIRVGPDTRKGYRRSDLVGPWSRYVCPAHGVPPPSPDAPRCGVCGGESSATRHAENPDKSGPCGGVADVAGDAPAGDGAQHGEGPGS